MWTTTPTQEGTYWFYGWPNENYTHLDPILLLVVVREGQSKWETLTGPPLDKTQCLGVFSKLEFPNLPKLRISEIGVLGWKER